MYTAWPWPAGTELQLENEIGDRYGKNAERCWNSRRGLGGNPGADVPFHPGIEKGCPPDPHHGDGEVVFEALIPYEIALLVNEVKAGCGLDRILHYSGILLLMALCALGCGYAAGITCARASCGFARNLRQDVF